VVIGGETETKNMNFDKSENPLEKKSEKSLTVSDKGTD
jgi:hypothetical protein